MRRSCIQSEIETRVAKQRAWEEFPGIKGEKKIQPVRQNTSGTNPTGLMSKTVSGEGFPRRTQEPEYAGSIPAAVISVD